MKMFLYYLCTRLPGGLGFGRHGSHELGRHPHVFHLNPLHLHPPRFGGNVKRLLDIDDKKLK